VETMTAINTTPESTGHGIDNIKTHC